MQQLIKLISAIKFLLLPAAIILTSLILVLSLIKTDGMPKIEVKQADKYFHGTAYFFLTATWMLAFYFQLKFRKWSSYVLLVVCIIIFGTIIEVLQMTLTDYRSFDVFDILANSTGAILFFVVYLISKRIFSRFKDEN